MPLRKTILVTGEFYHIFNRSVHNTPIFKNKWDCKVFLESAKFYLQANPPTRFSIYRKQRRKYPIDLKSQLVTIVAYCLMPTHFHFILRQEKDNGIKQFMQKLSNSYAHYFNKKNKARGPVFEGNFKAVRIETEEQLLHLSRYVHLNPSSSYLVKNPQDYHYSSFRVYLKKEKSDFVNAYPVMNNTNGKEYQKFVLEHKDYQKELQQIKHLILE